MLDSDIKFLKELIKKLNPDIEIKVLNKQKNGTT